MSRTFALTAIALATLAFNARAIAADQCRDLDSWTGVPANVRLTLESAVGPVADKGQSFNATDLVRSGLASNRFIAACQTKDFVAVAIERGGRGYHIEVFHYKDGKEIRRWSQFVGVDRKAAVNLLEPLHER
jgi:hypothetical protein